MNKKLTHKELVEIGAKSLMKEYHIVITEMLTWMVQVAGIPDILGFNYENSVLIEVKTSISDLKKDKEKFIRQAFITGVGDFRYFLIPYEIYNKALEFIPKEWGIYTYKNGKIRLKRQSEHFKVDWKSERHFILSALRRLKIEESNIVKIVKVPTRAKRRNIYLNENNFLGYSEEEFLKKYAKGLKIPYSFFKAEEEEEPF